MNPEFWHQRWMENQIAFHEGAANPFLVNYFNRLGLSKNERVFVPLCGKTIDVHWLLKQGFHVVGAELSEIAIKQLFEELNLQATIEKQEHVTHYSAKNIDIFVGDIFNLSREDIGEIDATYDRAALIALPQAMRLQYSQHLQTITQTAKQLLIVIEYEQSLMPGPPFSLFDKEVKQLYKDAYKLKLLDMKTMEDGLKGQLPASEKVWLLT